MAYEMTATAVPSMTLKVIHRLQAFSSAICGTFVQHFTRFQVTMCLRSLCISELFV